MPIFRKFLLSLKRKIFKRKPLKRKISKRKKPSRPKPNSRKKKRLGKSHKRFVRKVKSAKKSSKPPKQDLGVLVGEVTHYFSRIQVCVIKITKGKIMVGDRLKIIGHTTNFIQSVQSLQIENADVPSARKGALVGLKVNKRTRAGDKVYKL